MRVLILTATWLLPLGWTVVWGVFRGAYAHGGFVWWDDAHHAGLLVLGLAALGLHWRQGGPWPSRELVALGLAPAGLLLMVTWLSFQCGLAVHDPPDSVSAFLFDEP